jgi:hypothetical protein
MVGNVFLDVQQASISLVKSAKEVIIIIIIIITIIIIIIIINLFFLILRYCGTWGGVVVKALRY